MHKNYLSFPFYKMFDENHVNILLEFTIGAFYWNMKYKCGILHNFFYETDKTDDFEILNLL